ncbi:hypothetical protein C8Q79DRAFT_901358 [Trametes meyenii]|nr:hypothetical protein C8Q79DRAFT_901358 [Trametes meyenii]
MTKHLRRWEEKGWCGVANADIIKETVAIVRGRSAVTTFRWVKGHAGDRGNEGADKLAKEGIEKPRAFAPIDLPAPRKYIVKGAALASMTQRSAYQGIRRWAKRGAKRSTEKRLTAACNAVEEMTGELHKEESLWRALRGKEIAKKVRDFVWKCLHGAHKIGKYWTKVPGYEERAVCRLCGVEESMEHILTKCGNAAVREAWSLGAALLAKRGIQMPVPSAGLVMGAPALNLLGEGGRVKAGDTRLARICITETAYLVWVLRCERVIGGRQGEEEHVGGEVRNRWLAAINRRFEMDRALTRVAVAEKKALSEKSVLETWRGLLKDEERMRKKWINTPGVLVGMPAVGDYPPPLGGDVNRWKSHTEAYACVHKAFPLGRQQGHCP